MHRQTNGTWPKIVFAIRFVVLTIVYFFLKKSNIKSLSINYASNPINLTIKCFGLLLLKFLVILKIHGFDFNVQCYRN